MIKVAVVDNAESAKKKLKEFLQRYQEKQGIQFLTAYFEDGADLLENYQLVYDLIFLDVEMPRKDGMTTAKEIRKVDPYVSLVFLTRMAQYAVNGYEVNAMDYLVKPINYSAFELRMNHVLEHLQKREETYILINVSGGVRKIPVSRLIYVEVIKHRLLYHTEDGVFETADSMKRLETELEGRGFERCDNSFLVNLKYVTWVGAKELIAGGETIKVSRPRRKAFLQALTNYIGGTL